MLISDQTKHTEVLISDQSKQTKVLIYLAIMEPWLQLNHEFPALVLILGVKRIPEKNQYPPSFYGPIIKQTLDSIVGEVKHPTEKSLIQSNTRSGKVALFMQYRGKCTEDNARALHKINAPCTIILTLRKLKTVLPSLKPPVEKMLKSGLVYRLMCPHCSACYVG